VSISKYHLQVSQSIEDSISFFLYDGPLKLSGSERLTNKGH
jgi:hypothetical protein